MKATVKDALIESAIMRQHAISAEEKHTDYSVEGNASDFAQRMATQPIRVAVYGAVSHSSEHKKYPTKKNAAAQSSNPPTPAGQSIPRRTVHLTQNPAYRPAETTQSGFSEQGRILFKGKVEQRRSAALNLQRSRLALESGNAGLQTPSAAQKLTIADASGVKYPAPASAVRREVAAKTNPAAKKAAPTVRPPQKVSGKKTTPNKRTLNKTADKAWVQQQAKEQGKKKAQREAAKKAKKAASKGVRSVTTATNSTVGTVRKILQFPGKAVSTVMRPLLLVLAIFFVLSVGSILLVFGTSYGIFVSTDGGLREVVNEINTDFEKQLKAVRRNQVYDQLDMSGAQSDWRTVLSVYAVLVTTDAENPTEVISMDEVKEELLREIFWQMHAISWTLGTIEVPNPDSLPSEDELDPLTLNTFSQHRSALQVVPLTSATNPPEPTETIPPTIEQTVLYITISHKSAAAMARYYNFTDEQKAQLEELLLPANKRLWNDVIYGISTGGNGDIVAVAASQIGNYNGNPYWTWYGLSKRVGWCAIFISWCANECGYIEDGTVPKTASPTHMLEFFQEQNRWCGSSYTPSPGDIIFLDYPDRGNTGACDHVGIVEYVENGIAHTVEGNLNNSVERRQRVLSDSKIMGYGVLDADSMIPEKEGETIDTTPVRDTGPGTVQRPAVLLHPEDIRRAAAAYKRQRQYWKTSAI